MSEMALIKKEIGSVILLLAVAVAVASTFTCTAAIDEEDKKFDHVQMALTWPPTFCAQPKTSCVETLPQDFTLHGIWPADKLGGSILCPKESREYDNAYLTRRLEPVFLILDHDLRDLRLSRVWPSLSSGKTAQQLWRHEYKKHAICPDASIEPTTYFEAGIRMRGEIDFIGAFRYHKVSPSDHNAYEQDDIKKAVRAALALPVDYEIYIACHPIDETHAKLHEVLVCLDKDMKTYIGCPESDELNTRGCEVNEVTLKIILPLTYKFIHKSL